MSFGILWFFKWVYIQLSDRWEHLSPSLCSFGWGCLTGGGKEQGKRKGRLILNSTADVSDIILLYTHLCPWCGNYCYSSRFTFEKMGAQRSSNKWKARCSPSQASAGFHPALLLRREEPTDLHCSPLTLPTRLQTAGLPSRYFNSN